MLKKRIFPFLLIVCVLMTLIPAEALADDENPSLSAEARYQSSANGEWLYGSLSYACQSVYNGGRVELLQDISLSSNIAITKKLTLTSIDPDNPCTITYQSKDRGDCLFVVSSDVTMENIILDGGWKEGYTSNAELVMLQKGTLTLNSGAILQNNNNINTSLGAGALRVNHGTAVINTGAVIQNCQAIGGGGAATSNADATIVLNGGSISHCKAFIGGGVCILGTGALRIYSGSISDNESKKSIPGLSFGFYPFHIPGAGGGIYIGSGYVYMFGGSVSKNSSEASGAGIGTKAGVIQLAGGSVSQNFSKEYAGGILVSPSTQVLVGNSPVVTENTAGNKYFHNLHLEGIEDDSPSYATKPIIIGAALRGDSRIDVSRWTRPDKDHPFRIVAVPASNYTITEDDLARFTSDDPAYIVLIKEIDGVNNIVLTTNPHTHDWADDWSSNQNSHWHECIADGCPLTEISQKDGYASHVEDGGTVTVAPTADSDGVMTYRCSVCQYVIRTEVIPKGSDTPEDSDSNTNQPAPKTGDAHSIFLYGCLLILTLIAGGIVSSLYFREGAISQVSKK